MKKAPLGQNGPLVNRVGFGCMSFGGIFGATNEADSHRALAKAIDLGVNHLDVANIYGEGVSEHVIGSFLKANPHPFSIATKAAIVTKPERRFDNSREYLTQELDASLQRLGVNHVDLFYIHRRDPSIPVEDVMDTLLRFVDQGKIGGIGFSEIAPATLDRACACGSVAAVQSEYSLWTRMPELGLLQACARNDVTFVSFSPVARGVLTDAPPDPTQFRDVDFRKYNPRFIEPNYNRNLKAIEPLRTWAHDRGTTLSALAIAWTLAKVPGSIAIPGTRSAEHLEQNVAALDVSLTDDDLTEIERLLPAGFAHGDRYSDAQRVGVELYC